MKIKKTKIEGCYIIEPKIFHDNRGFFFEVFNQNLLKKFRINNFIQENHSFSKKGVFRGMHYQKNPYSQNKLVRVVKGKILDVVCDLRKNSKSYTEVLEIEISCKNKNMIFIPSGIAHGFISLTKETHLCYLVDKKYSIKHEMGFNFNSIKRKLKKINQKKDFSLSIKDINLPSINL